MPTLFKIPYSRLYQDLHSVFGIAAQSALAVGFLLGVGWRCYLAFRAHLVKADEATAQYRAIIDNTQDGVIVVDDEGLIGSVNPSAETMFGQRATSVIGKSISMLVPQRLFFQDMANMGRGSIMAVGLRNSYYQFPIEISLSAIKVNGSRQFCALIRDVTERKRGEEILKQIGLGVSAATGEEFVRSLLKQLSKALEHERAFLVELTGPVGTPTALLTIAERGELRATVSLDLAHSACLSVITGGFRAYPELARTTFPEDAMLRECEAEAFVGMPLCDHANKPIGVIGVLDRHPIHEVSLIESTLQIFATRAAAEIERKRYEGALAAEKERLAVTLRSIADGCISLDNDGRVLMLNQVAERLTGWSQGAAEGQGLGEILHLLDERTRKKCQHALSLIVATGSKAILVSRDGTERFVESNSSPIRDHAGRKVGVVIVLRDITERHRIGDERQQGMETALQRKEMLLKEIHHRFRNSLQSVSSLLKAAAKDFRENRVSLKTAPDVFQSAQCRLDAMHLLHEELYRSRDQTDIDINSYIGRILCSIRESFGLHEDAILFKFDIDPVIFSLEIAAPCGLIITELVTNSIKHAFSDCCVREIEVSLKQVGAGSYLLKIKDNGKGFMDKSLPEKRNSSGLKLIAGLADQLHAEHSFTYDHGVLFQMSFPDLPPQHANITDQR